MGNSMRIASFLQRYDTIVFDMDGVVTSEQNYWNSAALTAWEYCRSKNYYGTEKICPEEWMKQVSSIRSNVFCGDELIRVLKEKGVNSNWDLGYVVFCLSRILKTDRFEAVLEEANKLDGNILGEYPMLAQKMASALGGTPEDYSRSSAFWNQMQRCFQEWFLGQELYNKTYGEVPKQAGKSGLLLKEEPIIPLEQLTAVFAGLFRAGKRICVGTGRPGCEIEAPLKNWGLLQYIAPDGFIHYDHVAEAEKELQMQVLTKPHPLMFLKAVYGEGYQNSRLLAQDYETQKIEKTLVVGDAGADILAAQTMGADFCAVLTGITGAAARPYFEDLGAAYIIKDIRDLLE